MSRPRLLLLDAPPVDWVVGSVQVLASPSGFPARQKAVEPAGAAYHAYVHLKVMGSRLDEVLKLDDSKDDEERLDAELRARYEKKKHQRSSLLTDGEEDLYELLDLGHLRYRATSRQIKDAYRAACLKHHPDKQDTAAAAADDKLFKLIQKAYDTLSDTEKRRAFDSSEPFDDSLPDPSSINNDNFFVVFGEVFDRNSRWSVSRTIPTIGNASTPLDKVVEFYEFWRNFRSWRDFSVNDEYDPDESDSREEKRWMQRQNSKQREKQKKEERARINTLVDLAYQRDPRIIAHKNQQEQERENAKAARRAEREARDLAEKREQEELLQKQRDEEERQKKEREQLTKDLRKKRTRVRQLGTKFRATSPAVFTEASVELVCSAGGVFPAAELNVRLGELISKLAANESDVSAAQSAFEAELAVINEKQEALTKQRLALSSTAKKKKELEAASWSPDELSMLAKGLAKFPAGVRDRWRQVSDLIGTKSVEEVIAKTMEAKTDRPTELRNANETESAFQQFREKTKRPKREANVDGGISTRDQLESAEPWTQEEQNLLEEGLLEFYADDDERWEQISEKVGTRSKNECIRRYRYLVAYVQHLKQKTSTSTSTATSSSSSSTLSD